MSACVCECTHMCLHDRTYISRKEYMSYPLKQHYACMYAFMHKHTRTCVSMHMRTCTRAFAYAYMYACFRTCVHVRVFSHIHVHTSSPSCGITICHPAVAIAHAYIWCMYAHACEYACLSMHTRVCTCVCLRKSYSQAKHECCNPTWISEDSKQWFGRGNIKTEIEQGERVESEHSSWEGGCITQVRARSSISSTAVDFNLQMHVTEDYSVWRRARPADES
jgi:hypothetical protein